jgi:hypothetical protein
MRWCSWAFVVILAAGVRADDAFQPTEPTPEHEWLAQLAGEWESEGKIEIPGQSPITCTGTENARMLGDLWLIADGEGQMMGQTMRTHLMLGYDPEAEQFVGTWVDSANGYMWKYEGTLDERTQTLVLDTSGPCPFKGGEITNFRESIRIVDEDHKIFTSEFENEDGSWQAVVTVESTRVEDSHANE